MHIHFLFYPSFKWFHSTPHQAGNDERLIYEASDMLYHLIVLLTSKGLSIDDLARELQERHDPSWHKH